MGCIHSKTPPRPCPRTGDEILQSIDSAVPRFLRRDSVEGQFLDEDLAEDRSNVGSPRRRSDELGSLAGELSPLGLELPRSVKETFQLKVGVLEGTTFLNDYVVVDTLGRGSHGKVKLCLNVMDNHLYAIKIVETAAVTKQAKTRLARQSLRAKNSQEQDASRYSVASMSLKSDGEPSVVGDGGVAGARPSLVAGAEGQSSKSLAGMEATGSRPGAESRLSVESTGSTFSTFGSHHGLGGGLHSGRLETTPTISMSHALEKEADVMKALNHPNLVRLYEVIRSDSGKLLMVMEYCHAGPLVDTEGRFSHCQSDMPEIIVHHFFKQMTSAISYLHSEGIVHGDIKPENMLLSGDGTVKIADFGQSLKIMQEGGASATGRRTSKLTRTLGTPAFLAPEICAGEEYDGFAADVWALGVTLYSFMFGKLPFEGSTVVDLYDTIAEKEVEFPVGTALSIELQDLFLRLLHKNPKFRITAEELVMHPWVMRSDSELLEMEHMFDDESCLPPEFQVVRGPSPPGGSRGSSPRTSSPQAVPHVSLESYTRDAINSDDGHDGEIGPDPDASPVVPRSKSAGAGDVDGRRSPRDGSGANLENKESFGVDIMRSLSYIVREFDGGNPDKSGVGVPGMPQTASSSGASSSVKRPASVLYPAATTLEEFNSITDQLLKSQQLIIQKRSRKGFSNASSTTISSVSLMREPQASSETSLGPPLTAGRSSCASPAPAGPYKSPFEVDLADGSAANAAASTHPGYDKGENPPSVVESVQDAMRTADEVAGAALMHFVAGEFIDGFGFDAQQYAYYIDSGEMDIRYMADLPVPLDEIVGVCLEDVIVSHFSADLTHADSVCYTENASKFVFKEQTRESSSRFASIPPLQVLQTMFETMIQGRAASTSNGAAEDASRLSADTSVHKFVEHSEREMGMAQGGNIGDLLISARGEGQFIGALSLLHPDYFQNKWTFSAVATTDVTVIKMNKDALQKFLIVHPLSQISLRASMSRTVSDLVKLEMYERISLARRKLRDTSKRMSSSSTTLSAANQGFEEVARHLTETALAGAEILAKLDLFALASRLRDDAQLTLGLKKSSPADIVHTYEI